MKQQQQWEEQPWNPKDLPHSPGTPSFVLLDKLLNFIDH